MKKIIFKIFTKKRSLEITHPCYILKSEMIEALKTIKGYKSDAELARALGISASHFSHIKAGREKCDMIMAKIDLLLGNTENKYGEIRQDPKIPLGEDRHHQRNNMKKSKGEMPYAWGEAASARTKNKRNHNIEIEDRDLRTNEIHQALIDGDKEKYDTLTGRNKK